MFATLSQPYAIAGQTISDFAIATYKTLTSQQAQRIYKDAYVITSVVIQVTALALYAAGLCTVTAGRKFRAYYDAEWATDVERFLSYPDRCLAEKLTADIASAGPEETQPVIPAAVQTILGSNWKTTKKLRTIATHYGIRWRNARGEGRHMLNPEIIDLLPHQIQAVL